ncbi:MAG: 3-oxoacyl-[acyl-carrier-protein] synthase III C-terminal domain-containing protein [Ilumatobacteraceae bacterium]
MEGKEVFRRAVRLMVDSAEKAMAAAGVTADDIALIVPHQANIRIIQAACDRLGVPIERAARRSTARQHRRPRSRSHSPTLRRRPGPERRPRPCLVGFGGG